MSTWKKKIHSSWCVFISGTCEFDRLVSYGHSEEEARLKARSLNQKLNIEEGIPNKAPFVFYYAEHGNHVIGKDWHGIDRWIDECNSGLDANPDQFPQSEEP